MSKRTTIREIRILHRNLNKTLESLTQAKNELAGAAFGATVSIFQARVYLKEIERKIKRLDEMIKKLNGRTPPKNSLLEDKTIIQNSLVHLEKARREIANKPRRSK